MNTKPNRFDLLSMRIFIILLVSFSVFSCKLDLDENLSVEKISIFDIQIPQRLALNEENTITFKYAFINGCYALYDVESYLIDGNTLVTTVFAEVDNTGVCTQEYSEQTYTLSFKPIHAQTYLLRFWKEQDEEGEDQYEEFEVVVE